MEKRYDLIVVGAGAVGLSCAWRCAQAGMSVLVVDREAPGAGASGVAAGMLAPVTEASFGEEALLRLNLAGRALWSSFAHELEELTGHSTGYSNSGALVVAVDRDDLEELRRLHAFQHELGLESEWLGTRDARAREPGISPRIGGAVYAPQDGYADPWGIIRALSEALRSEGGQLRTETEVAGLKTQDGRVVGVTTAGGESIEADVVLVAAGAWSSEGWLAAEVSAPEIRPVKGQLLELRVRRAHRPPARRVIRTLRCYVVTRPDGRVVVGATQEEQGFDTSVTADGVYELLEAAREVLPDIGELELVRARAGLRPATPDNCPAVGLSDVEGLVWATGHHRNGILLAPLTGRAVCDLLTTGEMPETCAAFRPDRFRGVRV